MWFCHLIIDDFQISLNINLEKKIVSLEHLVNSHEDLKKRIHNEPDWNDLELESVNIVEPR